MIISLWFIYNNCWSFEYNSNTPSSSSMLQKVFPEEVEFQRSLRYNKGIPPKRYGIGSNTEADSNIAENGFLVQDSNFQSCYKDAPGKVTSAKSMINRECSWRFESSRWSDVIRPNRVDYGDIQSRTLPKNGSISSKSSNVLKLNFEIERLQQLSLKRKKLHNV